MRTHSLMKATNVMAELIAHALEDTITPREWYDFVEDNPHFLQD